MPIYEFFCGFCKSTEERLLSIGHGFQSCTVCGTALAKQLSIFGFTFNDQSVETLTKKQKKHAKRCREHFLKQDREEAIARGADEWKAGTNTDDIEKTKPNKWGTKRTASETLSQ